MFTETENVNTVETENINATFTNDDIDLGTFDPTASDKFYPADPRPGKHRFTFALQSGEGYEGQPFEEVERQGKKVLRVNYKLNYEVQGKDGNTFSKTLNFIRADFFQSPAMKAAGIVSDGAKLVAALGLNPSPFTQENVKAALSEADGRVQVDAKTGIRYYDKEAGVETTTNPRKNSTQVLWPKTEKGEWAFSIINSAGKKVAGNAYPVELYRIK